MPPRLLTYADENAAQGTAEKALYADYQAKRDAYLAVAKAGTKAVEDAMGDDNVLLLVRQEYANKGPAIFSPSPCRHGGPSSSSTSRALPKRPRPWRTK